MQMQPVVNGVPRKMLDRIGLVAVNANAFCGGKQMKKKKKEKRKAIDVDR